MRNGIFLHYRSCDRVKEVATSGTDGDVTKFPCLPCTLSQDLWLHSSQLQVYYTPPFLLYLHFHSNKGGSKSNEWKIEYFNGIFDICAL